MYIHIYVYICIHICIYCPFIPAPAASCQFRAGNGIQEGAGEEGVDDQQEQRRIKQWGCGQSVLIAGANVRKFAAQQPGARRLVAPCFVGRDVPIVTPTWLRDCISNQVCAPRARQRHRAEVATPQPSVESTRRQRRVHNTRSGHECKGAHQTKDWAQSAGRRTSWLNTNTSAECIYVYTNEKIKTISQQSSRHDERDFSMSRDHPPRRVPSSGE